MENKNVGYLVLGISVVIVVIIWIFNRTLKDIVALSCGNIHGESCPMLVTVNQQTYLALAIVAVLVIIGLVLIFSKQSERVIVQTKTVKEKAKKKEYDLKGLRKEDKEVFNIVKEQGTIFQADLIEKTGFGKAKMSRVIDRLEGKGFVERKRRGMTNVVVLKED
jgi:uncharacterized membrane protein